MGEGDSRGIKLWESKGGKTVDGKTDTRWVERKQSADEKKPGGKMERQTQN